MGSILALLLVLVVSIVTVRIGATALRMTGLSWDAAMFQAHSAFFSVGFTTTEAEMVVNHPVRRRIIMHMILVGNMWFAGIVASVIVTFGTIERWDEGLELTGLILVGVLLIWLASKTPVVRAVADRVIRFSLERAGHVHVVDYALMLRVHAGYYVTEVEINRDHPLVGQTLAQGKLGQRGIVVLGIERADGSYVGAPNGQTHIEQGDMLMAYGQEDNLSALAGTSWSEHDHPTL